MSIGFILSVIFSLNVSDHQRLQLAREVQVGIGFGPDGPDDVDMELFSTLTAPTECSSTCGNSFPLFYKARTIVLEIEMNGRDLRNTRDKTKLTCEKLYRVHQFAGPERRLPQAQKTQLVSPSWSFVALTLHFRRSEVVSKVFGTIESTAQYTFAYTKIKVSKHVRKTRRVLRHPTPLGQFVTETQE